MFPLLLLWLVNARRQASKIGTALFHGHCFSREGTTLRTGGRAAHSTHMGGATGSSPLTRRSKTDGSMRLCATEVQARRRTVTEWAATSPLYTALDAQNVWWVCWGLGCVLPTLLCGVCARYSRGFFLSGMRLQMCSCDRRRLRFSCN